MASQHAEMELVSPESLASDSGYSSANDWLEIVQPDWPEPPDGGFTEWAADKGKGLTIGSFMEYWAEYKSHCLEDGALEVEIQVHLSRPDLAYAITASYGELSDKFAATGEHTYSETVQNADSIDLEREIVGEVERSWEGPVIGLDLAHIEPPPEITQDGSVLSWGMKIAIGVLRLKYAENHDTYILSINPRPAGEYDPDEPETAYQSTVIAVPVGGDPVFHDVDLPSMSGNCRPAVAINSGDDDDDAECYDLHIKYHKCTGEEISRNLVRVPCPTEEETAADDETEEDEGT